jgi:regulator of sigma E protease
MISLIIFLFILGLLVVVHEFGHFIIAKRIGVRVEKFSLGLGRKLFSKQKGDTQYCINAIPLGGYVKLAGDNLEDFKGNKDEYLSQPPGKRAVIIVFGPLLNYVLGFLFFWLICFVGYPSFTTKVGGLVDGFGAKESGIQIGDRIMAVDGQGIALWEDLQNIIKAKKAETIVRLSVLRNERESTIEVKIKEEQVSDLLGQKHSVGLLGITRGDEFIKVRHGFLKSFSLGINKTVELTSLTYKALWRMILGKLAIRETVTGPLGMFYITSKAASLGVIAVLHLMAVLSVSLAIFNLLPLPVLDGGHLFFLVIEKLRGKALSLKTELIVTRIGFTLLISLAILVTYNDILRVFQDRAQLKPDTEEAQLNPSVGPKKAIKIGVTDK